MSFVAEMRAVRSMEALREKSQVRAKFLQERKNLQVAAESLVPGDVLLLDSGAVITADIRVALANKLQANEFGLTGESVPVGKQTGEVEARTPLAERSSMLFKGTGVTRGTGESIVVAKGMETGVIGGHWYRGWTSRPSLSVRS
jgi:Ca2+-transporting ATPase